MKTANENIYHNRQGCRKTTLSQRNFRRGPESCLIHGDNFPFQGEFGIFIWLVYEFGSLKVYNRLILQIEIVGGIYIEVSPKI